MDVLRNTGTFAERSYSNARPLSEMEHQGLNGSYRQGFVSCVEHISNLAIPPKEKAVPLPAPFGELKDLTPNPKSKPPQ